MVLNYHHKICKSEIIHVHASAILHPGRVFPALMQQETLQYPQMVWMGFE